LNQRLMKTPAVSRRAWPNIVRITRVLPGDMDHEVSNLG
jgi:hypothetical protein